MSIANVFAVELERQIKEREKKEDIPRSRWICSGGTTRRPLEDQEWWLKNGPAHIERWLVFRETHPIWRTPEGDLGIELDITTRLPNKVTIRVIIDRLCLDPDGELGIVDIKTGNSMPESALQLAIGAVAVEQEYGVRPTWGMYFKTRGARNQKPVSLSRFTLPLVQNMLAEMVKARAVKAYPPRLTRLCDWCSVGYACAANGGIEAVRYDPLHPDFGSPS